MATPLSFTTPSKRNSKSLPLGSGSTFTAGYNLPSPGVPSALQTHRHTLSSTSMSSPRDLRYPDESPLASPTSAGFNLPPIISATSSTHAGGIQPPVSFFRPSRPEAQRPPSTISESSAGAQETEILNLTKHASNSSEDATASINGQQSAPEEFYQKPVTPRRAKYSREPLLPASPGNLRPSLAQGLSDRSMGAGSETGRRVRQSLDRFRRGISFESRHSGAATSPSAEGSYSLSPYKTEHQLSVRPTSDGSASPSPSYAGSHIFKPTPPAHDPPLSAIPIMDPKSAIVNPNKTKPLRNYQRHPSRNRFFFRGRVLTGGDSPYAFVGAFVLVMSVAGVWFATTCVWWWHNMSPAVAAVGAYMCLITVSTMLSTALRDPGILPRNLDPEPPYPSTSPSDGGNRAPMPRDLKVRDDTVRVKYCPTCRTYRPPRSSHCKMCDNCVDGCDHHCQWVNNCVGRRNYTSFFVFLTSAVLTACLIIVTSALHIYFLTRLNGYDFKGALTHAPGSAVAFSMAFCLLWPIAALHAYHMRLLLLNITTIEQIRNSAHKALVQGPTPPNPFSHGNWRRNLFAVLCRPAGYSWLDAAGVATEDRREVNPGMVEVNPLRSAKSPGSGMKSS